MTAARFEELKRNRLLLCTVSEQEAKEFNQTLQWENRSKAAKRAVQTKRRRYSTWPTRRRDHSWNNWAEKHEFDIQAD